MRKANKVQCKYNLLYTGAIFLTKYILIQYELVATYKEKHTAMVHNYENAIQGTYDNEKLQFNNRDLKL